MAVLALELAECLLDRSLARDVALGSHDVGQACSDLADRA
jgi:hypothetical protein